jgi:hypothetical protein
MSCLWSFLQRLQIPFPQAFSSALPEHSFRRSPTRSHWTLVGTHRSFLLVSIACMALAGMVIVVLLTACVAFKLRSRSGKHPVQDEPVAMSRSSLSYQGVCATRRCQAVAAASQRRLVPLGAHGDAAPGYGAFGYPTPLWICGLHQVLLWGVGSNRLQ